MRDLLVRLMSVVSKQETINELQNQQKTSDDKPTLASALKARTL